MHRGEIRWYTFAQPDKRRPVLLLGREEIVGVLNEVIVVPATRTIRGIASEVILSADDGMPATCALNFDHVSLAQHSRLGPALTTLRPERWPEVESALLVACGFEPRELMAPVAGG